MFIGTKFVRLVSVSSMKVTELIEDGMITIYLNSVKIFILCILTQKLEKQSSLLSRARQPFRLNSRCTCDCQLLINYVMSLG